MMLVGAGEVVKEEDMGGLLLCLYLGSRDVSTGFGLV